ncbi:MAG: hypothetical protein A3H37_05200 [Candidatus Schekmanbacteria bacterium RIFCSPLOWO2_02_FULL_38_14]|nr:MAG: hypothetical protein A3H37_05200 [Candidatus Schekmanbacteria bacterium RIFCSPLOWO2_02_FULL_38_14]
MTLSMETQDIKEKRTPYFLILVFIILSAGIITTGYLYCRNYEKHRRIEMENQLSAIAELKISEIKLWRKERFDNGEIFYKNASFAAIVQRYFKNPGNMNLQKELHIWISQIRANYNYDRVRLLDANGDVRLSVPATTEPLSSAVKQHVAETLRSGQMRFMDFYRHNISRDIRLGLLVPIIDTRPGGVPIGVLFLRINPYSYLYPFIQRWPTPSKTAETLIIRREGNEAVFLNELRFQKNTALTLRASLNRKKQPEVMAVSGQKGVVEGIDYRGSPVLAAVGAIPDSPWFLVSRMDSEEVYAPLQEQLWVTVILVVTLLISVGMATWFIWRQQSMSFYRKMYEAAKVLRKSEERYRVLFEQASVGVAEIETATGRFVRINRKYCEIVGYTSDEMKQLDFPTITHPDDLQADMENMEMFKTGRIREFTMEKRYICKDGSLAWVSLAVSPMWESGNTPDYHIAVVQDITERKEAEKRERLSHNVLDILNRHETTSDAINDILFLVKNTTGIEAVAIRLREGSDFPYYKANGFTGSFLQAENSLYSRDELGNIVCDKDGKPFLECMCGNILYGRTDAKLPFFTKGGSFWTNSTTDLLKTTTDINCLARMQNRCNNEGYESVALIPLRSDKEIIGLLQLNDRRRNRFTLETIHFFEWLGASVGITLLRSQIEKTLRKSEERFRQITESKEECIWEVNAVGLYTYISPVVEKILGYKPEEIIGKKYFYNFFAPDVKEKIKTAAFEYFARKQTFKGFSNQSVHKQGNIVIIETAGVPVLDSKGTLLGYRGVDIDVTKRRQIENQFRQSQKMEAVGTLAGGIAHDFNNMLTAIIGYASIAMNNMEQDSPNRLNIKHVLEAAEQASQLTQSLLTFSRKQITDIKPVDLNEIIRKVQKFLVRVIGEDIKIRIVLNESDVNILADSSQIEQVIMNLATNARDAMPKGGMLTIETALTEIDSEFIIAHSYGKPGKYAIMSATDTGIGMDEETKKKIFEPFFTTKKVGKGTGLGLSMAYGIIKQHDGYINVYSEPGEGTTFRIYLPLALVKKETADEKSMENKLIPNGTETVLVAEDDKMLQKLTSEVLSESGYTVILAQDGQEAVDKFIEHRDSIQLLLFDIIMPKKNGKEAYDEIIKICPSMKVLFISGYAADIIREKGILKDGLSFVTKPISPTALLRKVREVLD